MKQIIILITLITVSCESSDSDTAASDASSGTSTGSTATDDESSLVYFSGTVGSSFALTGSSVSHVIAVDTDSKETKVSEVSDNTFSIGVAKDSAQLITLIDDSKTGSEMIVATIKADELDTMPVTEEAEDLVMGEIAIDEEATEESSATASMGTAIASMLESLGTVSSAISSLGKIDDVGTRYTNPDVNGNGEIDSQETPAFDFVLDFHNRYTIKVDGNGVTIADIANEFPADTASISYSGTGISFEIDQDYFSTAPSTYSYSFSNDATLNESDMTGTLTAGNTHEKSLDTSSAAANSVSSYQFSIEANPPPNGTYTVSINDVTYTLKDVNIPSLTAAEGFLMPFIRLDVDSDDTVTGMSWKWMKKTTDGWEAATEQEIKLVVAGSAGAAFYVEEDGNRKTLSISITTEPTGSETFTADTESDFTTLPKYTEFNAMPGISYDDKLGMRYFMNIATN